MLSEYSFKISSQELQVIVGALHEGPYRAVAPLLVKLQGQVTEQETAAQATNQGAGEGGS